MKPFWIPKNKPNAEGRDAPDAWLRGEGKMNVKADAEVEFVYVEEVDGERKETVVKHRAVASGEGLSFMVIP